MDSKIDSATVNVIEDLVYIYCGREMTYSSVRGTVRYITRHNVSIEAELPEGWGITRVVQFMESLAKADLI